MNTVCLILIVLQLASIVIAIRKKRIMNWVLALATEVISIAIGIVCAFYYNGLPGRGKAPGLTYFGEAYTSFGITVICFIFILITVILMGIQMHKKKDRNV